MNKQKIIVIIFFLFVFLSCKKDEIEVYEPYKIKNYILAGSLNSVNDKSVNAFGLQSKGLLGIDELNFFVGNSFFNQNWVTAPASTTARDGLGPLFNASSCASCHFKDGRGTPLLNNNEKSFGFLIRLSQPGQNNFGGPLPDPLYGNQLNDQAINGVPTEGNVNVTFEFLNGKYADGTSYQLRKPVYSIVNWQYGVPNSEPLISPRVGQQMIGLGLLEAIEENTILSFADEHDADGDGISGRPNYVWDFISSSTKIGKFGWKANSPNIKQQVAHAFLGDLGITTPLFKDENCMNGQTECLNATNGGTPELDNEGLEKTVLYASNLSVPIMRSYTNSQVVKGAQLFEKLKCNSCHKTNIKTGNHPKFNHLSNQTIHPYTDLLLHDMGEDLSDNRSDFLATGREWRTPPLWGIGLFQTVNNHTFYLHDGRARNIEEAILWHGGEAKKNTDEFKKLNATERNQLIQFLNAL